MNTKLLISAALASIFAAGAVSAQEASPAPVPASTASRAEVKAELQRAIAAGELDNRGQSYGSFNATQLASTKSRADVQAEVAQARPNRTFFNGGEAYGSFDATTLASTKTRAEVKREVVQAIASGQHLSQGDRSVN